MERLPLQGVRVIDSTYIVAMPYAGAIMSDLGAEVIKLEGPGHVDTSRKVVNPEGPDDVIGSDFWNRAASFNLLNRGKRSLTLDLSHPEGRELFTRLVQVSDVVVENYTPRVMRRWGLDYPNLKKVKPDIIMVSNTGYGHGTGPYANYPGQATTMEGTHGLCSITGYRNDIASKAGRSFVDFLACWTALFTIASALRYRNRTGKGQWIELGMYQLGCMFMGEYIMDQAVNGRFTERMGNRHPWRAPQGCYPCAGDDQWCVISVGDDQQWSSLCHQMGRQECIDNPRYIDRVSRMKHHDELDDLIAAWTRTLDKYQVMELLQGVGVPAGGVFHSKDTNLNPHLWDRRFLEKVTASAEREMGTRVLMGRPWRLSKTPLGIRDMAPSLGESNHAILHDLLNVNIERLAELENADVINTIPTTVRLGTRGAGRDPNIPGQGQWTYDPDYKKNLII